MQIQVNNVTAGYKIGPVRKLHVLKNIHLTIPDGSFSAVVGHTGAGKSSLLKTMNGLLIPNEGMVNVGDLIVSKDSSPLELKSIRKRVGMVFQFPESQLFAETVEKDICFGPMNFGVSINDAKKIAKRVIQMVGLEEDVLERSPFSLSGGQMRRVAIAGVLAMEPDILVLDEPGAGLDPAGKREILSLLKAWNEERGLTIVLVTHDMDDVARLAHQVIVMDHGEIAYQGTVRTFFEDSDQLEKWHLDLPEARRFQLRLENEIGIKLPKICLTEEELAEQLIEVGII